MAEPVTIVLVGIGGYGEVYLSALLDEPQGARCRIVGAVDPHPENCARLTELEARGVPLHPSLEDFYRTGSADLAVISSPIHLHAEHACLALSRDSHVLVEKPAAAVTADVDAMIEARERARRFVAVGFQWSFARSILDLKQDILAGRFGVPLSGRSLTLWPRTESYYGRNDWAGRRRDAAGRWILDSPANNAMAHHLHNLLFLLGSQLDRSAEPADVSARLARANDIETFDTIAARVRTAEGTELLFLASHAVAEDESVEPRFVLEFDDATVSFTGEAAPITARSRDGRVVEYASPNATPQVAKLWICIEAVSGDVHIPCGLETARPHTACIEAIENSGTITHVLAKEAVRLSDTPGGRLHWVPGLAASLEQSYETGQWPEIPDSR
ncbi:MAG: Gfo/Idh/MocA family oxidoreductase [Gemmatimonadales bacterium]|jgi:predicted dehydrogenase